MQELDELLPFLVDNVDGATVAAVGGMDGLLIEQYPQSERDLSATAAQLSNVITAARGTIQDGLEGGNVKELMITAEKAISYVRMLNQDLFCVIVMNPAGNIGKARLYTDQVADKILEVFV